MTYHVTSDLRTVPGRFAEPVHLVTNRAGATLTRQAIELADGRNDIDLVIGWVDLTAPNLVDLIDDFLATDRHGCFGGLRVCCKAAELDDLATQRGLATLEQYSLKAWFDDQNVAALAQTRWPGLSVADVPLP